MYNYYSPLIGKKGPLFNFIRQTVVKQITNKKKNIYHFI